MCSLGGTGAQDLLYLFKKRWTEAKKEVVTILAQPAPPELGKLALPNPDGKPHPKRGPKSSISGSLVEQKDLLSEEDQNWLHMRHSTRAYAELLHWGAVQCADEFNEIVVHLVALAQNSFVDRFW